MDLFHVCRIYAAIHSFSEQAGCLFYLCFQFTLNDLQHAEQNKRQTALYLLGLSSYQLNCIES